MIKTCPFCGSAVYVEKKPLWEEYGGTIRGYYGDYEFVIECKSLKCNIRPRINKFHTIYEKDEQKLIQQTIDAWNERV